MFALVLSFAAPLSAQPENLSEHALKTFEIFKTIVEVDTSKAMGNTPKVARYLADELIAAGFPEEDIEILRKGDLAALIARYRGDGSSGKKPILFLGHMDVVEAYAEDWERPPFELTSDETYFYARGTIDNKFGVAQLTSTFIRLKKEGFVPTRDLIIAFSGDEKSGMTTTRELGFAEYDPVGALAVLIKHTEIKPEFEGKGYGSELVRRMLDDVRQQGKTVITICPYALNFIRRHPEYIELVQPDMRSAI